jgi:hypothetical protein
MNGTKSGLLYTSLDPSHEDEYYDYACTAFIYSVVD